MNKIYTAGALVDQTDINYVVDALQNGWYDNKYKYVELLEYEISKKYKRQYALMTPNCTTALQLILTALNIQKDDEVIVPDCTWIASVVAAHHLGAKLIFCDIDDNWCIDVNKIEKLITEKTRAIISVDLFGNMPNWDRLNEISTQYNIPIIEDAAEAMGSSYKNIPAGKHGIASVFSFHNTKTITTGEGGMLLLDDDELFKKCVLLRDLGRDSTTPQYYNSIIGYKLIPSNIQAALGLSQFRKLDQLLSIKEYHYTFYKNQLNKHDLQFNQETTDIKNGKWITTIIISKKYNINKIEILELLNKKNIPARPFFYPLTSLPAFNLKEYRTINVNSYDISNRGISLPGAYNLTDDQLLYISNELNNILNDRLI